MPLTYTATSPSNPPQFVDIFYTNWQGKQRTRRIEPMMLWFGSTTWHPYPQWLLRARDCEHEGKVKDFAMSGITSWSGVEVFMEAPGEKLFCTECRQSFDEDSVEDHVGHKTFERGKAEGLSTGLSSPVSKTDVP